MIRTSHRGSTHKQGAGRLFINGHPTLHCHRLAVYIQRSDGGWLRKGHSHSERRPSMGEY
ncbi:unnamed protein product, partial [Staurois parvus]